MKHLWIDLKCLLAAFILTLLLCCIAAAVIYFTPIGESLMRPLGVAILAIGIFSAGAMSGRVFGSHGILLGLRIGIISVIFMIIATLLLSPSSLGFGQILSTLLIVLPVGATGGIIGVGFHQKSGK